MAETMLVAFGRYLRTLRERRQYSLDDVASLTRLSPDPILKGYLSRCENGHTRIGFSKMNTLCQVYEVPLDVVAERHSLDMELDKIGGPETKGKSFEDLVASAATAFKQGRRWDAYAQMRDALALARLATLMSGFRDTSEQGACLEMNVATTAAALGKSRFAVHELEHLLSSSGLGPSYRPMLLERLAGRLLFQGDVQKARQLSDRSIAEAELTSPRPYLGYFYLTRALVAGHEAEFSEAIEYYKKAYDSFNSAGRKPECANTLMNLAQTYFDAKRLSSARRAIRSAERLAVAVEHHGVRVRARILLGEIESLEGKTSEAADRWHEAVGIAKNVRDRILQFKAEYRLFEQAVELENSNVAASLERRLRKLSFWVPQHVDELQSFRRACARKRNASGKRVASAQRPHSHGRNPSRTQPLM
jgi:transcriptional regulator with XRE-family HTH domain